MNDEGIPRRLLLKRAGALGLLAALQPILPSCASHPLPPVTRSGQDSSTLSGELIDLVISERSFEINTG
ncbi:MAG: hypothetical protein KF693_04730 [Nitrospira sp.]|nr:hypothetical protein [Nitrospira sp.]